MTRSSGLIVMRMLMWCAASAGILVLAGCASGSRGLPPVVNASATVTTGSESRMPVVKLRLGSGTLTAELASTPVQTTTGLAFRAGLAWDRAMIFVYSAPHRASFYMKNTSIPLSGAYIDSSGKILEIHDLKPGDETPVVSRTDNVQFVLEVNRGWFEKNGVTTGSQMYLEQ